MMEKYGVDHSQVDDLVKLGVAKSDDEARTLVAAGKGAQLIKTAQAKAAEPPTPEQGELDLGTASKPGG